jgi:hypothetical protein
LRSGSTECGRRPLGLDPARDRLAAGRGSPLDVAAANLRDQRRGLGLRIDVELAPQQRFEFRRARQRLVLTVVAGRQPQHQPLPILPQRVERQQPFGGGERPAAIACRIPTLGTGREHATGRRLDPTALHLQPFFEALLVDRQSGEEVPVVELGCLLRICERPRSRQFLEVEGVR